MPFGLQNFLFHSAPTRRALLSYEPKREKDCRIQVFRNHSFELVEHTIAAYLDYARIGAVFSYSGYDDSLSFSELDEDADLLLLWIDLTRYAGPDTIPFLTGRIAQLKLRYKKPILLIPFGGEVSVEGAGTPVMSLSGLQSSLGAGFTDERAKAVAGTALSSKALLAVSAELGLRYLPALLRPALKAVVVDLDNTLYQGVLGEDGIGGIILTEGHRLLQQELKRLAAQGIFLCAASKNDSGDVEALFEQRGDFPLKKSDFAKICASWGQKAASIQEIAAFLNINPDSMLFIDDNIGELAAVQMAFPDIWMINACEDAAETCETLRHFPGLLRLSSSKEDSIRKGDVQANEQRRAMQNALSQEDYIRSLDLHLTFHFGDQRQSARIAELSNKTNQFIFNYMRYSQPEVDERMRSDEYRIAAVSLSDRLSDSGLIGVCVGKRHPDYVEIEELFISCRALGRGIDDMIVLGAIQGVMDYFHREKVLIRFREGERNAPAGQFVREKLEGYLDAPRPFSYRIPEGLVTAAFIQNKGNEG